MGIRPWQVAAWERLKLYSEVKSGKAQNGVIIS
jgi:hypothetical protein